MTTFAFPEVDSAECAGCHRVLAKDEFAFPYECLSCADDAQSEWLSEMADGYSESAWYEDAR